MNKKQNEQKAEQKTSAVDAIVSGTTHNGLENDEFKEIKKWLYKDAKSVLSIANSETGHLGDIISRIKTAVSSLKLKAEKLNDTFKKQKEYH